MDAKIKYVNHTLWTISRYFIFVIAKRKTVRMLSDIFSNSAVQFVLPQCNWFGGIFGKMLLNRVLVILILLEHVNRESERPRDRERERDQIRPFPWVKSHGTDTLSMHNILLLIQLNSWCFVICTKIIDKDNAASYTMLPRNFAIEQWLANANITGLRKFSTSDDQNIFWSIFKSRWSKYSRMTEIFVVSIDQGVNNRTHSEQSIFSSSLKWQ